jgi:hypothetical protein
MSCSFTPVACRGVVDLGHEAPDEGVMAVALPARDDVEALIELRQQIRDLGRVVLEIGIHRDDDVAGRDLDAGCERRRLSEVPAQPHDPDVQMRRMQSHELAIRPVGRAVVDEDDLPLGSRRRKRRPELAIQRLERRILVQERYYNGESAASLIGSRHAGAGRQAERLNALDSCRFAAGNRHLWSVLRYPRFIRAPSTRWGQPFGRSSEGNCV